jgi:hypothetical protein
VLRDGLCRVGWGWKLCLFSRGLARGLRGLEGRVDGLDIKKLEEDSTLDRLESLVILSDVGFKEDSDVPVCFENAEWKGGWGNRADMINTGT